ncbi:unnamed protein product [Mytilus coruscus]|uniref:G-protein coupled receptors family 2 profile 2 domain-containing protein n=1 Tax=Mytilus coruscus TaxID=42192 RepID=A0A6J8ACP7_MYTCO|nr:unnamed protein product [Mytilus coruscus]
MLFNVCLFAYICTISAEESGSFIYRYPSDVDLKEVYDLTENFQDANQRRILEKQLLYCPMVPLCNNLTRQDSYPNGTSSGVDSCCYQCSCQENGLVTNGNCPNIEITLSTPVKTCIYPQYLPHGRSSVTADDAFYMISSCPTNFHDATVTRKCTANQRKNDQFDISLFTPVSILNTSILFKNKYCAICNYHVPDEMYPWSGNLSCDTAGSFEPFDNLTASGNVLKEISNFDDCNIFFQGLDPISDLEQCDWGIYTTCNQTGNWRAYDKFVDDACTSYTSVYVAKYRNVFCYLCNSNEMPFMGCNHSDFKQNKGGIKTGTFVGLISFIEDEQKRNDEICANDEVFDTYELDKDDCSMSCVSDDSRTVESGICSYIQRTLSGIDCCYLLEWHYPKDIRNVTHREYIVGITLLAITSHIQRTYIEALSSPFEVNNQKEVVNNVSAILRITLFVQPISHKALDLASDFIEWDLITDYYDSYYEYRFYNEYDDTMCVSTHPVIQVVSNFFCPRIKLKFNEVELSTNHLTVLSNNIQYDINTVLQNEEYFLVCADIYMPSIKNLWQKVSARTNKIETLLSLICSMASITSLTLTLIVYILLKDLRTLPGLQQMMLSIHLLVAHALYLFGINAESTETLCAAVGLLTHYFWLGSIMWMHICTLEMFRVFYYNNHCTSNRLKQFTRYVIYSVSVPSLLITINIVNFFSSDESTHGYLGYGGESSYIIEITMVLYTFAIPVGVLLLLNIILFSVVIFQLETALEIKSETRKSRPMLIIYTKMSCLTGITWIFGFVYQWTLIDVSSCFYNLECFTRIIHLSSVRFEYLRKIKD